MTRKDYRVTVKVRNNNILSAAEARGFHSIPRLAQEAGIGYQFLNSLINMTESPFNAKGEVRHQVESLILTLNTPFDELFSEQQCDALESNKTVREYDAEEMYALEAQPVPGICHDDGMAEAVSEAMKCLRPNELRVIRARLGFDGQEQTFRSIAEGMDISVERVRQIEAKALRKLRHPSQTTKTRQFTQANAK